MPFLKALGIATLNVLSTCKNPITQAEPTQEQTIPSACERFRTAIGVENAVEEMASHPASWKYFPAPLAEAA